MMVLFKLTMPNIGSWNGKWTGSEKLYAKVVNLGRGKKATEKAKEIVDKGYYHYNFGDGWAAGIYTSAINAKEANKIRRKSAGFCGYDCMVDSIIENGKIIAQRPEK